MSLEAWRAHHCHFYDAASLRGLPSQGGGGGGGAMSSPDSDLVNELRQLQYNDDSTARRVQDIRASATLPPTTSGKTSRTDDDDASSVPPVGVATWALRATEPVLGKLNFGAISRYQGRIVGPPSSSSTQRLSSSSSSSSSTSIAVNFDFSSDWLQLDRANGGVQFVDQRNRDQLCLLRVTLPAGMTIVDRAQAVLCHGAFLIRLDRWSDPENERSKIPASPQRHCPPR
jgi:hypothetical protein